MLNFTQEEIKSLIKYDPDTGIFTRLVYKRLTKYGNRADVPQFYGYRQIYIKGENYPAHRIAWFYMTGEWPENTIDHKDGVRDNNKWENLRKASYSQNRQNSIVHKNNLLGVKGVYKTKKGKYRAMIGLGTFDTLEEATEVFRNAAKKLHGEFYKD